MLKIAGIFLGAITLLIVLIGGAVDGVLGVFVSSGTSYPSNTALTDIPPDYLTLYKKAAQTCPGLDWAILAAIGKIETNHGRSHLPGVHNGENTAGAGGPMQFLQNTFNRVVSRHPLPPGGVGPPSRYNPHDAIYTAAAYLCDSGARHGRDLHSAIFAYNHADWYIAHVLTQAKHYHNTPITGTDGAPSALALQAINYAHRQLGQPYVWGGNGPQDGGFDCSGLTKAAYAAAGITLLRTADAQFRTGPHVPPGAPLAPGDLVFYGDPTTTITHVGLYIGGGRIIHAPTFGQPVRLAPYRWNNDAFAGATRPVNQDLSHQMQH